MNAYRGIIQQIVEVEYNVELSVALRAKRAEQMHAKPTTATTTKHDERKRGFSPDCPSTPVDHSAPFTGMKRADRALRGDGGKTTD